MLPVFRVMLDDFPVLDGKANFLKRQVIVCGFFIGMFGDFNSTVANRVDNNFDVHCAVPHPVLSRDKPIAPGINDGSGLTATAPRAFHDIQKNLITDGVIKNFSGKLNKAQSTAGRNRGRRVRRNRVGDAKRG